MIKTVKQLYIINSMDEVSIFTYYLLATVEHGLDPTTASLDADELKFVENALNVPFKRTITKVLNKIAKPMTGKLLILTCTIAYLIYVAEE